MQHLTYTTPGKAATKSTIAFYGYLIVRISFSIILLHAHVRTFLIAFDPIGSARNSNWRGSLFQIDVIECHWQNSSTCVIRFRFLNIIISHTCSAAYDFIQNGNTF